MWKAVEKKFVCNAVIVESPIKTLEETIKNKEWFKGIVLSVTYFEHFGVLKLKEHFKGKIFLDENKLKHLGVEQMIILLYGSGLIDDNTYSKMMEIKKKRIKLVHDPWTQQIELDPKDAERLIKKAIECLEILGAP